MVSICGRTPVVVDNRGGTGGTLAAVTVATAPADGHTLLFDADGSKFDCASRPKAEAVWRALPEVNAPF